MDVDGKVDDYLIPATQQKQQPTPPQTLAKSQRHEAFKNKLLGRTFGRRKSLDFDEAAGASGLVGAEPAPLNENDDDEDEDERGGGGSAFASQKMQGLREKLTAKAKGKGKEVKGKKKLNPVGPSGQTWTPLEMQVSLGRVSDGWEDS